MAQLLALPKPYRDYPDLVALLESRGMTILDKSRAERKLAQIGYYRLSGFWYPCRIIKRDATGQVVLSVSQKPEREERFQPLTDFQSIIKLYLFDKKLRQLMLDAIERIEVHVRSVIAHEVGYHNPLAYQDPIFINPSQTKTWKDKRGKTRNSLTFALWFPPALQVKITFIRVFEEMRFAKIYTAYRVIT